MNYDYMTEDHETVLSLLANENNGKYDYRILDDLELMGLIDEDDYLTDAGYDYLEKQGF